MLSRALFFFFIIIIIIIIVIIILIVRRPAQYLCDALAEPHPSFENFYSEKVWHTHTHTHTHTRTCTHARTHAPTHTYNNTPASRSSTPRRCGTHKHTITHARTHTHTHTQAHTTPPQLRDLPRGEGVHVCTYARARRTHTLSYTRSLARSLARARTHARTHTCTRAYRLSVLVYSVVHKANNAPLIFVLNINKC